VDIPRESYARGESCIFDMGELVRSEWTKGARLERPLSAVAVMSDPFRDAGIRNTVSTDNQVTNWMSRPEQRAIFVAAVGALAAAAGEVAGSQSIDRHERCFYDGVGLAAQHALHPVADNAPPPEAEGLDRAERAFRDGYLTAAAQLINAMSAEEPPLRIPLPSFRV
jgi:hypothetical protein